MIAGWFDDPALVRRLPPLYRFHAGYCRVMANRQTGNIRGGSRLYRFLRDIQRHLPTTTAQIPVNSSKILVDLLDERWTWVIGEARGTSEDHHILHALLKPGDTFIDLGANHGGFSVVASQLVGPTGLVIAIEPQPRLAALLRKSLALNSFSRFEVHQCTALDFEGTTELFIPCQGSGTAGIFSAFSGNGEHRSLQVPSTTLDRLLTHQPIGGSLFLKIDVEGSELLALRGGENTFRKHLPNLLIELNPTSAAAAGYSVHDLLSLLQSFGYATAAEVNRFPSTTPLMALPADKQRNVLIVSPR